jgi:hypothetical protein
MTLIITGSKELMRKLAAAGPLAKTAIVAGAIEEQEKVIAGAVPRTPFDEGILKGSAGVLPPNLSGPDVDIVAGYGGAASSYAVPQHEEDYKHSVGEKKYLLKAWNERLPKMGKELGDAIERALRRLKGRR